MLKQLQPLKKELSLIAHSGIQLLDYGFSADPEKPFQRTFLERQEERPDGLFDVLRAVRKLPQQDVWVHAETEQPIESQATYRVTLEQALKVYDGVWVPAPFFKHKGKEVHSDRAMFERGPTN